MLDIDKINRYKCKWRIIAHIIHTKESNKMSSSSVIFMAVICGTYLDLTGN